MKRLSHALCPEGSHRLWKEHDLKGPDSVIQLEIT